MQNKTHNITYLKARTSSNYSRTLQQDMERLLEELPTTDKRIIEKTEKTYVMTVLEKREGMIFFQVVAYSPGEQASIISNNIKDKATVELGQVAPPEGTEFSNGDLICLVSGDDVYVCPSVMSYEKLASVLIDFFEQQNWNPRGDEWGFELIQQANEDVVREIQNKGVKSVSIRAGTSLASVSGYAVKKNENFLFRLFRVDTSMAECIAKAAANVMLTINLERGAARSEWLDDEAAKACLTHADYVIKTLDGAVYTPEKIKISIPRKFKPNGNSVFLGDAFATLKKVKTDVFHK